MFVITTTTLYDSPLAPNSKSCYAIVNKKPFTVCTAVPDIFRTNSTISSPK